MCSWTSEVQRYVAMVLGQCPLRVVWSMQSWMTAQLVPDALVKAVWRRPEPALHHSDRGSQYTSTRIEHLLGELDIILSKSRSGKCRDNSAMESFFKSLKTERTDAHAYRAGSR
ncbi:hypothetical protein CA260_03470 [Dyella jiangningensis]|uniref:Integrase catalytic domain-containing protein n=2 Tax=Dyella jiangningensis TaxID=1379159 RepID=A0A328P5S2_9GAMM|nr:hypothetical protein CA260_03470 [Dyella jiangningensis]